MNLQKIKGSQSFPLIYIHTENMHETNKIHLELAETQVEICIRRHDFRRLKPMILLLLVILNRAPPRQGTENMKSRSLLLRLFSFGKSNETNKNH